MPHCDFPYCAKTTKTSVLYIRLCAKSHQNKNQSSSWNWRKSNPTSLNKNNNNKKKDEEEPNVSTPWQSLYNLSEYVAQYNTYCHNYGKIESIWLKEMTEVLENIKFYLKMQKIVKRSRYRDLETENSKKFSEGQIS